MVDEKLNTLSNSVEVITKSQETLDLTVKEVMLKVAQLDEMQKELLENQRQVIRLSDKSEEKMAIIDSTNRPIEYLGVGNKPVMLRMRWMYKEVER